MLLDDLMPVYDVVEPITLPFAQRPRRSPRNATELAGSLPRLAYGVHRTCAPSSAPTGS